MALLLILPKSQLFNSLIFSIISCFQFQWFFFCFCFLPSVIFFCLLWAYFALLFLGCWGGALNLVTGDFSSFLTQTFNAVNFPSHTTLTVPFKLWNVSWIIQKFSSQVFGDFSFCFWFIVWLHCCQRTYYMISVLLDFLGFLLSSRIWSVLVYISQALGEKMYIPLLRAIF